MEVVHILYCTDAPFGFSFVECFKQLPVAEYFLVEGMLLLLHINSSHIVYISAVTDGNHSSAQEKGFLFFLSKSR